MPRRSFPFFETLIRFFAALFVLCFGMDWATPIPGKAPDCTRMPPGGKAFLAPDPEPRAALLAKAWAPSSPIREDHLHLVPPFLRGLLLHLREIRQCLREALQEDPSQVEVHRLAPPEHHRYQHLVLLLEESPGVIDLDHEVMLLALGSELDLLAPGHAGLLPVLSLVLGVRRLAVIHDL